MIDESMFIKRGSGRPVIQTEYIFGYGKIADKSVSLFPEYKK